MNAIGLQMQLQQGLMTSAYGSMAAFATGSAPCFSDEIAERKTGATYFAHLDLTAYDEALDPRVFSFVRTAFAPATSLPVPVPGDTLTWQGRVYTVVFVTPDALQDALSLLIYAYYAGVVYEVPVSRNLVTGVTGTGMTTALTQIAGSPFQARILRIRNNTDDYQQGQSGATTVYRERVLEFTDPTVPVMVNDIAILPDGTQARILRVRQFTERVQADLEEGTVGA